MGDPLGSPRVAPLFAFFYLYFIVFLRGIRLDNGNRKAAWDDTCRKGIFVNIKGVGRSRVRIGSVEYYEGRNKRIGCANTNGCDHTSTNAPDSIRTPKLSVLGRE